ncbi:MAG: sigma factor-like helix-turn-helix DNA-binding protein [Lachnospiraceae bacterium]|nr:sigma factor-like helix-turn-helix DNA-binding protein [Lachnospiraceae bacterium]
MIGKNELRDEEIYQLYLDGKTRAEIGQIYGISKVRVGQIVREARKREEFLLSEIYQIIRDANPDCEVSQYTRVYHALIRENVYMKDELIKFTKEIEGKNFVRIRNVGSKGLEMQLIL